VLNARNARAFNSLPIVPHTARSQCPTDSQEATATKVSQLEYRIHLLRTYRLPP